MPFGDRFSIASALMGMQPGMNMPWGSGGAGATPAVQPGSWLANMMGSGGFGGFGGSAPPAASPPAAAGPAAPPPPSFFGGGGMPQFGGFGGGMPNFGGAFNGAAINASLNPIMPPGGISGGIAGFGGFTPWDPTGGQMPPPGMEIRPNWQDAVSAASAGGSPGE